MMDLVGENTWEETEKEGGEEKKSEMNFHS